MGKPDDIEQRDWDAAEAVGEAVYGRHERGWVRWPLFDGHNLRVSIAHAIATARDEGRAEQEGEVKRLSRLATDRRYMMEAYRSMLGENGLKMAAIWYAKNVQRVHYSWGPDAFAMTGEERAAIMLEWDEAEKTAVPVESIDGDMATSAAIRKGEPC